MQTLDIREDAKVQDIAQDVVELVQAEKNVLVNAIGSEAISATITGIDLAKNILKKDGVFLNSKPVLSENKNENNEIETSISFRIIATPLFIEIAAFNPTDKNNPQSLN